MCPQASRSRGMIRGPARTLAGAVFPGQGHQREPRVLRNRVLLPRPCVLPHVMVDNGQLGGNPLTRPAPAEENAGGGPPSPPKGERGGGSEGHCQQLGGTGHSGQSADWRMVAQGRPQGPPLQRDFSKPCHTSRGPAEMQGRLGPPLQQTPGSKAITWCAMTGRLGPARKDLL